MSQVTNINVPNGTGLSVRTGFNDLGAALSTDFSGTTAPSNPVADMKWLDTSSTPPVMKRRNSANTTWEIDVSHVSASQAIVSAITDIVNIDDATYSVARVIGYATAGDVPERVIWLDTTDTTTTVDNIAVFLSKSGKRWKWKDHSGNLDVRFTGAKADGVTDDQPAIQAAITYLQSIGGGTLQLSRGTHVVASPIQVSGSNIRISGYGSDSFHDGGTGTAPATWIKYTGTAEDIAVVQFYTPSGTSNSKRSRCGLFDVAIDCAGVAAYGLSVTSINASVFRDVVIHHPTLFGVLVNCYAAGAIAEASDSQQNHFLRVSVRCFDVAASASAGGFLLTTVPTPGTAGANPSFNKFEYCTGQYVNGTGFVLQDADNNWFVSCTAVITGTGWGLDCQGADENFFLDFSSGGEPSKLHIRGTASGFFNNPVSNCFLYADTGNGTQYPILDAGCRVQWIGADGVSIQPEIQKLILVNSYASLIEARTLMTTSTTAVIYAGGLVIQPESNSNPINIVAGDQSANAGSNINAMQLFGNRYDGNQSFGGRLGLGYRRSDGTAISSGTSCGYVAFGGQWGTGVGYSAANFLYSASVVGVAEGSFTAASAMPIGIDFRTGSSGDTITAANTYIGTSRLRVQNDGVVRPGADNTQTLGSAAYRWSVVYAGTGTINTSDERAKQQIKPIDQAALRAWAKVNYCQFKYNDAVEEKGDDKARWHFGVIAQRVKEAFESEGLDAFAYGVLCYDEWPDVLEDVLREESIETQDGTTETRLVPTGEQRLVRPAGNRYGVRYEEALALECAYLRSKIL